MIPIPESREEGGPNRAFPPSEGDVAMTLHAEPLPGLPSFVDLHEMGWRPSTARFEVCHASAHPCCIGCFDSANFHLAAIQALFFSFQVDPPCNLRNRSIRTSAELCT